MKEKIELLGGRGACKLGEKMIKKRSHTPPPALRHGFTGDMYMHAFEPSTFISSRLRFESGSLYLAPSAHKSAFKDGAHLKLPDVITPPSAAFTSAASAAARSFTSVWKKRKKRKQA